jgi:hypothetical protein
MTNPAGQHVTDLCDECGKWRHTVEPFDGEYLCATCRKNHPLNMDRLQTAEDIALMRLCQMKWNDTKSSTTRRPRRCGA